MSPLDIAVGVIWVGVGATLTVDVWALIQRKLLRQPTLDYALLGRWIGHMRFGRFVHDNIRAAAPSPAEALIGWSAHYAIGIMFAALLIALTGPGWLQHPTILPAVGVGLVTVAAPFFVMQPGMGFGVASSRAPNPALARTRSLLNHLVFGLGMYLAALPLAALT